MPVSKKTSFSGIFILLLLVLISLLGVNMINPPDPLSSKASPNVFSAKRALHYLDTIALKAHPVGSRYHERVRDYICREVSKLGYEPRIQTEELFAPEFNEAIKVHNVIVHIRGSESNQAILIAGHYDSREYSFGASDDGSALITMLECMRAVSNLDTLQNDLVFLFSDAEEIELYGARAFMEKDTLAKKVKLALNFEASGTSGPSLMFETSEGNYHLIKNFANNAIDPVGNSMSYEIYRLMPNDTDFSIFKHYGVQGLNFAYLDGRYNYHTFGDNIQNTSFASIQHHGDHCLSMIKCFGNHDIGKTSDHNAVYFNTIGKRMSFYSYSWVWPFTIILSLFYLLLLFAGRKRKLIRWTGWIKGFIAFIMVLTLVGYLIYSINTYILNAFGENDFRLLYYNYKLLLVAYLAFAFAVIGLFYQILQKGVGFFQAIALWVVLILFLIPGDLFSINGIGLTLLYSLILFFLFRRSTNSMELAMGSYLAWLLLLIGISFFIPGASFLFLWPLFFLLIGQTYLIYGLKQTRAERLGEAFILLILAVPAVSWMMMVVYLLLISLGVKLIWSALLLFTILLSGLVPLLQYIHAYKSKRIHIGMLIIAIGLWIHIQYFTSYNQLHKKENSVVYADNGINDMRFLTTSDFELDEWTRQFFPNATDSVDMSDFHIGRRKQIANTSIDLPPLPLPQAHLVNDSLAGEDRYLRLHMTSIRDAELLDVFFRTKSGERVMVKVGKNDYAYLNAPNRPDDRLRYYNPADRGVLIDVKMKKGEPLEVYLSDTKHSLPAYIFHHYKDRPKDMMADGDKSIALQKYVF